MPAGEFVGVAFAEAIAYLRARLGIADSEWTSIMRGAQAAADAAVDAQAEAMRRDMLQAVTEIYKSGGTAQDFRAQYDATARRYGWTSAGDPGWHSNLIWRMEVFGARAAGRWEQGQRLQRARPGVQYYFRYLTAGDHRVRDTHAAWHGVILPVDHAWWLTHWPPNGFNCRCEPQIVTQRDLLRYGWVVTDDGDPRLQVAPDEGFAGNIGVAWELLGRGEG